MMLKYEFIGEVDRASALKRYTGFDSRSGQTKD